MLERARLGAADLGFVAIDLRSGTTGMSVQPDMMLPPASTLKTVTALYALDRLGDLHGVDPEITDPKLNLQGFFPLLLDAFGTWDGTVYGLPFDNYSGLLFYNRCMLEEAGFDGPPRREALACTLKVFDSA